MQISVYELSAEGEISLLTMFIDNDPNEVYYCVAWGRPIPPPQLVSSEYIATDLSSLCLGSPVCT